MATIEIKNSEQTAKALPKIAVYIVTYKRPEILERTVASMYAGVHDPSRVSLTIVNNHSDFTLPPQAASARVLHNATRSDHSWGHLSRDWNTCLVDAFHDWRGSDVDWCVLAHNDVDWLPDWQQRMDDLGDDLVFFSQPRGDTTLGLTLQAVREVGFFDERLTTIAFQEQDYLTRSMLVLGDRASVNDDHAGPASAWNPHPPILNTPQFHGYSTTAEDPLLHTAKFERELAGYMARKWAMCDFRDIFFRQRILDRYRSGLIRLPDEVDWYPFFWDGTDGPSGRSSLYEQPAAITSSYLVAEDDPQVVLNMLVYIAERSTQEAVEVLVDCREADAMRQIRQTVAGDIAFLVDAPSVWSREERLDRLRSMARSSNQLVVNNG